MYENILTSYEVQKQELDTLFIMATVTDTLVENKRNDAIECIFKLGKLTMLALILQIDFKNNKLDELEAMKKIKDYLQYDFLENLEVE